MYLIFTIITYYVGMFVVRMLTMMNLGVIALAEV
jgi:hypothetical protein